MARVPSPLQLFSALISPGPVLLLAAWALQHEEVARAAAAPYAVYFCFGALAAAVLLSWHHDQSRLLCLASAVALAVVGFDPPSGHVHARLLASVLLPLNFVLFTSVRERGVMTVSGVINVALVTAQVYGVVAIAEESSPALHSFLTWGASGASKAMPVPAQVSFAIAALTLLTFALVRRTRVDHGLLCALAAMFLACTETTTPDAPLFYAGTTGLVLVFAVLEHGHDIAYRDELTGLLGRRAFNNMMGQLGRTYAIAMCDVDHFKRFNDTYGHDVGDQVLRMVAAKLSQVGGGGQVFRYGGEEFLVVFRGRPAAEAEAFVDAVRKAVADGGFVLRSPDRPACKPRQLLPACETTRPTVTVTISAGIAEKSRRHSTPDLVLEAADAALYRAKDAGRNCVKLAEGVPAAAIA